MKTLLLLIVALSLPSCAGLSFEIRSPYGDASSSKGIITFAPKPFIIPTK